MKKQTVEVTRYFVDENWFYEAEINEEDHNFIDFTLGCKGFGTKEFVIGVPCTIENAEVYIIDNARVDIAKFIEAHEGEGYPELSEDFA